MFGTDTNGSIEREISCPRRGSRSVRLQGSCAVRSHTRKAQVLNSSGTGLSTLHTYSNLDHNTGYTQRTFDLSPYAGQTVTLKFTGSEDYEYQTSFVIDDTALNVS